jgi:protein-glutamine gamma-glutamyltransferase
VRFQATHKLMSYLLVLSALGTLASSDALAAIPALTFLVAAGASWLSDTGTPTARVIDRLALPLRAAVVAVFLLSAWQVWRRLPDPDLTPVLNLVMFLLAYKLFHRRANRDFLHVYILSFLMVLAAAAMAQSFLFAFAFALYVVLATWTLILFHLRREMEENYLVKHSIQAPSQKVGVNRILNSRRVVGGSFLASTGLVALAVFGGSVATFAMVPRIGAGFVLGSPRATRNLVGFSDEVALGQYGLLSTENQSVALRATVPAIASLPSDRRDREIERLYWRGTVYDSYNRGRWVRSRKPELRTHLDQRGTRYLIREPIFDGAQTPHAAHEAIAGADPHAVAAPAPAAAAPAAATAATAPAPSESGIGRGPHAILRQEIDVVGLSVPVAFALDHPIAFELPATKIGTLTELRLAPRWSGEVALRITPLDIGNGEGDDVHTYAGTHYVAYSRDAMSMMRAGVGRPLRDIDPAAVAPFLALPPSLSPRVIALARTITAGRTNAPAKLLAIIDWLRKTHEYTTNLQRNPAIPDPLEDFLFEQKAGHCEYFASATAVLLRASGVPSRYVNGFQGGEWNEIGRYIAVRENRAHSWAEAYLGELGWMRVDATPPTRNLFRMGRLRQLFDSLDFFWGRWVVGYDLTRQIDLARRLGHQLGGGPGDADGARHPWRFPWTKAAVAGGVAIGLWSLLRRLRRRGIGGRLGASGGGAGRGAGPPVARLYDKALRLLARRGLARRPSETPREFAARVAAGGVAGGDVLQQLTELYVGARFGRKPVADQRLRALADRLSELGRPAAPAAATTTTTT